MRKVSDAQVVAVEEPDDEDDVARVRGRTRFRRRTDNAFKEFLTRPAAYVGGLILLAGLAIIHDRRVMPWGKLVQENIATVVPPGAASMFLSTVTPGLLTVISIIFFVALMGVQHQSTRYSPVVLDQFMRRKLNQAFFGLFIGLTVYCLLALCLVPSERAVLSGTIGLILSVVTLVLLLVFIYSTMDQMRPSSAAWVLQNMALRARALQEPLLARCRTRARLDDTASTLVIADQVGYLVHIDGKALASSLHRAGGGDAEVEVELRVTMGDHVVPGGTLATVRGGSAQQRRQVAEETVGALTLGRLRDVDRDASHAVNQLSSMAWSATTSSGDLEGARVAVEALHGTLTLFRDLDVHGNADDYGGELPLVYHDPIANKIVEGLVNVIAASSVSHQHQTCADSLTVLSRLLPLQGEEIQRLVIERLERVLPIISEHLFTVNLENAFDLLRQAMYEVGEAQSARRLQQIKDELHRKHRLASPD